jgi:hypothetical protein
MSLQLINNGDLGEVARNKINLAIEALNTLLTVDSYSITVYDNSISPSGEISENDACTAITSGTSHTIYFTKGAGNADQGSIEYGDTLYSDDTLTTKLPNGYYGFQFGAAENKSVNVNNGLAEMINNCSGGEPGPAPGADSIQGWDQDPMMASGTSTAIDACSAISMGSSHDLYIQKDPMNMAGSSVPEVNDQLFTDSTLTNPAPMSVYFGWQDMMMAQNKSILIGMNGVISQIDNC